MKLVFALGNPGETYAATRHNIGWQCLEYLAQKAHCQFNQKTKFLAEIAEGDYEGEKVLFAKPTTFYNETGQSLRALVDYYKLNPATDVLVLHDDLALPFGTIRVRQNGSAAGNNGIKSINAHIGDGYYRIKIGTQNATRERMSDAQFVLSAFSKKEQAVIESSLLSTVRELFDDFMFNEIEPQSLNILSASTT